MSYVIRYGKETKQENKIRRNRQKQWLIWTAVGVCVMAAVWVPSVNKVVRSLLVPWLNDHTVAAFESMVGRIGEGMAIPAALTEFCREIIAGAQVPV